MTTSPRANAVAAILASRMSDKASSTKVNDNTSDIVLCSPCEKTAKVSTRKCGNCGQVGHSKRTCQAEPSAPAEAKVSTRKCGNCGQVGHSKRTCKAEPSAPTEPKVSTRKCGNCGQVGHSKRTCKAEPSAPTEPKVSTRKCGNCGQVGHNKRSCKNPFSTDHLIAKMARANKLPPPTNDPLRPTKSCNF